MERGGTAVVRQTLLRHVFVPSCVRAEGRGVHPPVPWIMDTVIDDAPAAGMRSRSPRDGVLNATLPRRAAPACVPDIRFWLAGDDAGTSGLRRFPTLNCLQLR